MIVELQFDSKNKKTSIEEINPIEYHPDCIYGVKACLALKRLKTSYVLVSTLEYLGVFDVEASQSASMSTKWMPSSLLPC
jgi:hypothetical protein